VAGDIGDISGTRFDTIGTEIKKYIIEIFTRNGK
jgi:hypothetical protein